MNKRWRVAGINFDHFHMGDLLRMVRDHPEAEIAGICDKQPARLADAARVFGLSTEQVFTSYRTCLECVKPDWVILCPATAEHALWTEQVAEYRLPVLIEKPFAASLVEADRMIGAMRKAAQPLAINWPLRWVPCHALAKRVIDEGLLGRVLEVRFYNGNRGPLYHGANKIEKEPTVEEKAASWFYDPARGGGSLLDYLGYGVTLGTWFLGGARPVEVSCLTSQTSGLSVDEHSITVARYEHGLSQFETRWGTFTDPWTYQPQPKCGFVLVGDQGTLSSYDYAPSIRVQTRERPEGYEIVAAELTPPNSNPVEYFIHCLETGEPVAGPLSPEISRIGQQIVDTAVLSAAEHRVQSLLP